MLKELLPEAYSASMLFSCESVCELFIQTPVWLKLQPLITPHHLIIPPTAPPAAVLLESKISAVWKAWTPAKAGIVAEWKICSFFSQNPPPAVADTQKALTFSLTPTNGDVRERSVLLCSNRKTSLMFDQSASQSYYFFFCFIIPAHSSLADKEHE